MVIVIKASCQNVELFEGAGVSEFDCSKEILLSSLTTTSLVVVSALETSTFLGGSEQVRLVRSLNIYLNHQNTHVLAHDTITYMCMWVLLVLVILI